VAAGAADVLSGSLPAPLAECTLVFEKQLQPNDVAKYHILVPKQGEGRQLAVGAVIECSLRGPAVGCGCLYQALADRGKGSVLGGMPLQLLHLLRAL